MSLRAYTPEDRPACLALFDGNVPEFFLATERQDFLDSLDEYERGEWNPAVYLVLEEAGGLVACGGAFVKAAGVGGLAWGMVARAHQREGLGTRLLRARLDWLRAQPGAREVWLDTTQHSAPFFRRFGFEVANETPDGYGPGVDRLDLRLGLD